MCSTDCVFDWPSFVDWFSIVSAVTTTVAAGLAALAILLASSQAKANAQLIADERETGHQFDLLTELLDLINDRDQNVFDRGTRWRAAHARLRMIYADLPTTRTRFTVFPNSSLRNEALGLVNDDNDFPEDTKRPDGTTIRNTMFDEVVAAIRRVGQLKPGDLAMLRGEARRREDAIAYAPTPNSPT